MPAASSQLLSFLILYKKCERKFLNYCFKDDQSCKFLHFFFYFISTISIANRYGHVSVQPELAKKFNVGESKIGGIMGIFYIPFVLSCLVYGYLGDRYNRKIIITITTYLQALGVFLCAISTTMPMFYAAKILMGLTQSAFITISPGILSDIYTEAERTKMIGLFYTAGAVGAGIGIIGMGVVASKINVVFAFTSYAVATAGLTTLYLLFVPNYARGASERKDKDDVKESENLKSQQLEISDGTKSSIVQDMKYLYKNKTYQFAIFAYAATSAVSETSLVWYQELLRRLMIIKGEHFACKEDFYFPDQKVNTTIGGLTLCSENNTFAIEKELKNETDIINCDNCNSETISTIFGLISIFCGMAGTMIGILLVQKLIGKVRNAGPLVASGGQFLAGSSIILLILICRNLEISLVWIITALIFASVTSCFGILADLIARVVVSDKRSLAFSIQNFVARAVGASFPPLLAGYITETKLRNAIIGWNDIKNSSDVSDLDSIYQEERFEAMKMGFLVIPTYAFVSCLLWYMTSRTFVKDEDKRLAAT